MSWIKHVDYLIESCNKRLNILKYLSKNRWTNSQNQLLIFYKQAIRSKIDYGCTLYMNGNNKALKKLDSLQYQCLKICTGALLGTPLSVLQIECHDAPLYIRRKESCIKLVTKTFFLNKHTCLESVLGKSKNLVNKTIFYSKYNIILNDLSKYIILGWSI